MLGAYIENKLTKEERQFVEFHFGRCAGCRKKFYEMSRIIGDLHYEYEKMLKEFEKLESDKSENLQEYEEFYNDMPLYADNELNYEDSIKFRKYLLKSKSARDELSKIYELRKNIKKSAAEFIGKTKINFSKKVLKRLKSVNSPGSSKRFSSRAKVFAAVLIAVILALTGFAYYSKSYAHTSKADIKKNAEFHSKEIFSKCIINNK